MGEDVAAAPMQRLPTSARDAEDAPLPPPRRDGDAVVQTKLQVED